MSHRILCNGNEAAALALRHARPGVLGLFPITPSTAAAEGVAEYVRQGLMDAEIVTVEGENSALSVCIGAAALGVRTATITSSQGLLYMAQQLFIAAGMRLPVVILDATRAVSAPLNVHGDHSDAMAMRASGCIQLYARNAQEVYDFTIAAFRIAEVARLPVMVCYDGFSVSHTITTVEPLPEHVAHDFLPDPTLEGTLCDLDHPQTFGAVCGPAFYTEVKYKQHEATREVTSLIESTLAGLSAVSGRHVPCLVESYLLDDATDVIVLLGSTTGTIREAVNRARNEGSAVGMLSLLCFRPFPEEVLRSLLLGKQRVIVLDRSDDMGTLSGPLFTEVRSALFGEDGCPDVLGTIYGLGGREMLPNEAWDLVSGKFCGVGATSMPSYLQVRENT